MIKYDHCPVPNCKRNIIKERSPHGLCSHHEELLDFLLFILPYIRVGQGNPKLPGLILPGQPGFTTPKEVIKQRIPNIKEVKK